MNATLLVLTAMWGQLDAGPALAPAAPLPMQVIGDEPTPAVGGNFSDPMQLAPPARFNPNAPPRFGEPTPAAAPHELRQQPNPQFQPFQPRGEIAPASGIGEARSPLSLGPPATLSPAPLGSPAAPHVARPTTRPETGAAMVTRALLDDALKAPAQGALAGHRLTLLEAITRVSEPSRRLAAVKHYWFVTYLVGEYHAALDASLHLQQLAQGARAQDRTALEAAVAEADARLHEAELNVVAAQYELAELSATPIAETLPLPADRPLVTEYDTRFETLFAGRTPPIALRRIDRTLPLRHGVVNTRATSLNAAIHHLTTETEGYRGGHVPLAALLTAHERVRENRSAFLMAVRQYNFDIAEYALSIATPGLRAETLVGMLIRDPKSTQKSVLVAPPSGVQPVSAQGPLGPEPVGAVAPAVRFEKLPAGGRPLQPELP